MTGPKTGGRSKNNRGALTTIRWVLESLSRARFVGLMDCLDVWGSITNFSGNRTTQELHLRCSFMASLFSIGRHVRRHALRQEFTE